tara:strand:- start:114 stop:1109 length:996 start_codon:yes stop_codon:yes gene_type:complete
MRQHVATFANFVCRFGGEKVMLDYIDEIVIPAFVDDKMIRSYGRTHFFFYETKLVVLDDNPEQPVMGISGRFIKNTQLTREQIFDREKGLVQDEASMPSAPSAFFILVLDTHRLIYFPETAHAPDLSAFRSTALSFIRKKHSDFINRRYVELRKSENKVTKKQLNIDHPSPTLEVVPISGDDEISEFVRRYGVLKKIEMRLIEPNDEIDGKELFDDIRSYLGPLNPDTTKLEIRNSDGLDIDEAVPKIKEATETANQEVKLSGTDQDGNRLTGDNHSFKVGAPIETIPPTRKGLTDKLYSTFQSLKTSGVIKVGTSTATVTGVMKKLKDLM